MDRVADLAVVGGGLAGFAAALTAAEAGLQVLLVEKQAAIGGSSVLSGGLFAFAGTDLQRAAGIEDSADLLFRDLREVGKYDNDEAVVRAYADNQLLTYGWLRAHGAEFSPTILTGSGVSVPRLHKVDPADLVRLLAARCNATGRVTTLMSAAAQRLHRDKTSGGVDGLSVEYEGSRILVGGTKGVILASGGFCRSAELMHRFAPQYDEAIVIGGDGNQGDGLRMAWHLGADFRDTGYINGTFGKHPTDKVNNHSCQAFYKGAIAVNQNGKRFVDESLSYKLLGAACIAQPYRTAYQIFDQDIFESGDNSSRNLDFERRLEAGLILQAESLEKLARQIEIDPAALVETVANYNGFVDAGNDPEFGRKHLTHKYGELRRIERAPFYACPSTVAVFGTYCGLCVDAQMRVKDVFGETIDGLLAAGEIVGGLHGAAFMGGSSLGKAVIFGQIAARTALRGR